MTNIANIRRGQNTPNKQDPPREVLTKGKVEPNVESEPCFQAAWVSWTHTVIIIALKRITRLTMLSQRLVFKFQLNGAAWGSALTGSQEMKYNVQCTMLSQSLVFNFQLNRAGSSLGFRNSHCDFNCFNRITRKTIQWNTMLSQSCFEVSTQRSRAKETTPAWVSSRYKDTKEYLTLWVTAIIVNRARQKKTTQA